MGIALAGKSIELAFAGKKIGAAIGGKKVLPEVIIGMNWTVRLGGIRYGHYPVCYGNGLFVAVANSTNALCKIITSPDGINWTARDAPAPNTSS